MSKDEIWKELPDLQFPSFILEKVDFEDLKNDLLDKTDILRERIQ